MPSPAKRIISLIPNNTEILFAVGAGTSVVGVTNYCDFPIQAQDITKIGDHTAMSLEKIVSLNPDLVLASKRNPEEIILSLRDLNITVFVIDPKTFEELFDSIIMIGDLTGYKFKAEKLVASYKSRLDGISIKIASLNKNDHPSVFVGSPSRNENWTPGPGTFISRVIERAGGRNIGESLPPGKWAVYTMEMLISKNPEFILSTMAEGEILAEVRKRILKQAKNLEGWQNLSAIRNSQIVLIPEDWLLRPGPRIIKAVEILSRSLHPTLF